MESKEPNKSQKITEKVKAWFMKLYTAIRDFFVRCYIRAKKSFITKKNKEAGISLPPEEALEGGTVIFTSAPVPQAPKQPELSDSEIRGKGRAPHLLFKKRSSDGHFPLQVLVSSSKLMILSLICICAVGLGAILGLANAYLESTPDLDLEQLTENDLTSYIYASDGTLLTTYAGVENRYYASLDEIPELLQKAVISIEDIRFYYHSGVDFKRLLGSFIGNLTGSSSAGGSTITQQLIKNQLLSSERSYKRKIQEAYLALQLEREYSKEQILEAYLNTIPLGGTNYGVKAAAIDYFGKELNELSLREIACLAGITQYPSAYSPRYVYYTLKDDTKLNRRIELVLNAMYQAGYISAEERSAALADSFDVIEVSTTNKMYNYPHFVEYAISDLIKQLLEFRGLEYNSANKAAIENELRTSGYSIYTTIDPGVQSALETTIQNYDNYPGLRNSDNSTIKQPDGSLTIQPQAAAVIMDQKTGQIKAMVGSRYVPTAKLTNNRAVTNKMPVGSSIKPIAVYGPAFDKGYSGGTVIDNILLPIEGWDSPEGYPTSSKGTLGPVTLRSAIVGSWNNVAARTLMRLTTIEDAALSLMNLGIEEARINKDGVGLALGSSGISPLQMTAAYCAIANGGTYIEPISFTKVVDQDGNTILLAEDVQEKHRAFNPSTAYMLVDILQNAVNSGTGKSARISGMNVGGKTGSVAYERGVVFAGFTPYYTSTIWIGHDNFERLEKSVAGGKTAAPLWQEYMAIIHSGLENRDILEGSYLDYGLVRATVCGVTGLMPNEYCALDPNHELITDYFAVGSVPVEICPVHQPQFICTESGMVCGDYCPLELRMEGAAVVLPEDSEYFLLEQKEVLSYFPNLLMPGAEDGTPPLVCTLHTAEWAMNQQLLNEAIANANGALSNANSFISNNTDRLSETQKNELREAVFALNRALSAQSPNASEIKELTNTLNDTVHRISGELPEAPGEDNPGGWWNPAA